MMKPSSKSVGVYLDENGAWVPLKRPRLEEVLKLNVTKCTSNMHAFDHLGQLRKYKSVHPIIAEHFHVRLAAYDKRRALLLDALKREMTILSNRARFILEQLDGTFTLYHRKYSEACALLEKRGFDKVHTASNETDDFGYLMSMSIHHYTQEKVNELLKQRDAKISEHEALNTTSRNVDRRPRRVRGRLRPLQATTRRLQSRDAFDAASLHTASSSRENHQEGDIDVVQGVLQQEDDGVGTRAPAWNQRFTSLGSSYSRPNHVSSPPLISHPKNHINKTPHIFFWSSEPSLELERLVLVGASTESVVRHVGV